ncbi:MAG TPA: alpha-ketoacid dehydrogenase subunit beta [Candidatus Aerophobetes bacterium]|uniref:Alpha-ketoacid dehydrogenase subunit beta n=1 Tax=Aerophobetes bacterium TaxID=2030807 RepID=A0A7C1MCC5_UNCAE|nr:alpha-ketoacid dehydrogenase subunit beta [Candidatus Aerophobetes bacterium]
MREITYLEAIKEALREEILRDDRVFLMGEDIGKHGGAFGLTKGLWEEFGDERIRNTPISENTIVGCAIGSAITGLRPVVEIMFIDFITLAMDEIVNAAAKIRYITGGEHKIPLVIRTQQGSGGLKGAGAQHSQSLEAWFVHIPGLKVVLPSTPYDAKGLLKASIRDNNPVIFIEHKNLYSLKGEVPQEDYIVPLGKASLKKKGSDITVLANQALLQQALGVAKEMEKEGIDIEVIDPMSYAPLDHQTIINSVKKTGRAVILQEAHKSCGVASEIGMVLMEECFDYLDAPVKRVTAMDLPIAFDVAEEKRCTPGKDDIRKAIEETLS